MKKRPSKLNPKRLLGLAVLIILALFLLLPAKGYETGATPQINTEELIRIHIRAHDNSEDSQNRKLQARDAVNAIVNDRLAECINIEEARRALEEALEEIRQAAEDASGQAATARLSKEYFPDRIYGEILYPAGEYEALIIELGDGQGENWWCVAFPPICYSSVKKVKPASEDKPVKVVYRSFIYTWLKKLFKR